MAGSSISISTTKVRAGPDHALQSIRVFAKMMDHAEIMYRNSAREVRISSGDQTDPRFGMSIDTISCASCLSKEKGEVGRHGTAQLYLLLLLTDKQKQTCVCEEAGEREATLAVNRRSRSIPWPSIATTSSPTTLEREIATKLPSRGVGGWQKKGRKSGAR